MTSFTFCNTLTYGMRTRFVPKQKRLLSDASPSTYKSSCMEGGADELEVKDCWRVAFAECWVDNIKIKTVEKVHRQTFNHSPSTKRLNLELHRIHSIPWSKSFSNLRSKAYIIGRWLVSFGKFMNIKEICENRWQFDRIPTVLLALSIESCHQFLVN